jgi:hypothetical protein
VGLQVKTSAWDAAHRENRVHIRRSSFRPAVSTFVLVLGWDREGGRFAEDCLVIPSVDVPELARVEGAWLVLELQPGSHSHRRLGEYETRLESLGAAVEGMLA